MMHVCWRAFALTILGLALIGCAQQTGTNLPSPSDRFSNVTKDYPAVVMVVLPEGKGICTGTFVSEKAVLTASHCLSDSGRYQVVASFGTFSTYTKVKSGPGVVDDPNDIGLLIFDDKVADRSQGQVYDFANVVRSGDTMRLVGFGCDNVDTRSGSGTKRTGTNVVSEVATYVVFETPRNSTNSNARGIIGPDNRAGSCFGDSGGPALTTTGNAQPAVGGVTHAGGADGNTQVSEYVDVANRNDNRAWLSSQNATYGLDMHGLN